MSKHMEKAKELRSQMPVTANCAQTILQAFAEDLEITDKQAAALGSNFGGGMKCGSTCGVITAGLMVLGAYGLDSPQQAQAFRKGIAEKHGGLTDCAQLLKRNTEMGGDKKSHCDGLIGEAIELIDEMIQGK